MSKETTKVITVRLPESMHQQLRREAVEQDTSLNKLCLHKLSMSHSPVSEPAVPDQQIEMFKHSRAELARSFFHSHNGKVEVKRPRS